MLDNKKTLIFEGAGCVPCNDVENCRIRTRIRNREGRLIYLEMGGLKYTGRVIPEWAKGFDFVGRVDSCFYDDASWDRRRNYSKGLSLLRNKHFEYSKKDIINFVNENLNCDFINMKVVNEGLYVHDAKDPLCDCSVKGYTQFEEIIVSIDELKDIKPLWQRKNINFIKYEVDCSKILYLIYNITKNYHEYEFKKRLHEPCMVRFRYDDNKTITDCEISCGFGCISICAEDLDGIIEIIKAS